MIPTPSLYTSTARPLFGDLAPKLEGDRLQVLYVTDKLPEQDAPGTTIGYGSQRYASGALGIAEVQIGNGGAQQHKKTQPRIEVASVEELVRFPTTPYLYRVEDHGRIKIDPEVAAELEQTKARARREIVKRLALTPKIRRWPPPKTCSAAASVLAPWSLPN